MTGAALAKPPVAKPPVAKAQAAQAYLVWVSVGLRTVAQTSDRRVKAGLIKAGLVKMVGAKAVCPHWYVRAAKRRWAAPVAVLPVPRLRRVLVWARASLVRPPMVRARAVQARLQRISVGFSKVARDKHRSIKVGLVAVYPRWNVRVAEPRWAVPVVALPIP